MVGFIWEKLILKIISAKFYLLEHQIRECQRGRCPNFLKIQHLGSSGNARALGRRKI